LTNFFSDPRFFLIENVPGLLQYPAFLAEQLGRLFQAGYFPVPAVLTAWKFGVPQERRRLFIMGYRDGQLPQWPTPEINHRTASVSTFAAVGDMLTQETGRPKPPWIESKFHGKDRIITDTRNRGYTPSKGRYFHARSIDLPAYTVLASERRGSKVIIIGDRCWQVSVEHNRRLQTFPDSWQFPDDHDTAQRLIGNAVPPLLARRIGQVINLHENTLPEQGILSGREDLNLRPHGLCP
jgi:DNA (cytosine-5)-methyltransferase 1